MGTVCSIHIVSGVTAHILCRQLELSTAAPARDRRIAELNCHRLESRLYANHAGSDERPSPWHGAVPMDCRLHSHRFQGYGIAGGSIHVLVPGRRVCTP